MNELQWLKDIKPGKELHRGEHYYMDFTETPFDDDVIRNKLYELVGNGWEEYGNNRVNWFNNGFIRDVGRKCVLTFRILEESPYIRSGWVDMKINGDKELRRFPRTELTLDEFLTCRI